MLLGWVSTLHGLLWATKHMYCLYLASCSCSPCSKLPVEGLS